jgi:hypothetical protein
MSLSKISYLTDSAFRYFTDKTCPSCGCSDVEMVDAKFIVTRLFKCKDCSLLFRHPKDSADFNFKFYQKVYAQNDGITTDLPSKEELEDLKRNNFKGKNVDLYCAIFAALLKNKSAKEIKVVDYGCSWGYQSFQFLQRGYTCNSYEISRPRAEYGNVNLGLSIKTDESQLPPDNDVFFSSHVIEHVPSPHKMIELGMGLLKSGGYFIAECPNGSKAFQKKHPNHFHHLWGKVHPNMLTADFYSTVFSAVPYFITSSPFNNVVNELNGWDQKSQVVSDTSGSEILVVAKKK